MAKKPGKKGGKKKGMPEFGCPRACSDVIVTGPGGKRKPLEFGLPVTLQIKGGETIRIDKGAGRRKR